MNAISHDLIQRYLEGLTTQEETGQLQTALKESAELRALFLDCTNLDAALCAAADTAAAVCLTNDTQTLPRPVRFRHWPLIATAAAACVALAFIAEHFTHSHKQPPSRPDLALAIESTRHAIAQMPTPPVSPLAAWMSPTASLLSQTQLAQ